MESLNLITHHITYRLSDTPVEVGNYFNYIGDVSGTGSSTDILIWFLGFLAGINLWHIWAVVVICAIANWVIFQKANRPGWAILIPIYGTVVYLDIIGRPWWWIFLLLIPVVNILVSIIIVDDLSKVFKHNSWFTLGLLFFPWVFLPILAFGKYIYISPYRLTK